jgi:hypothetical protein
MLLPNALLPIKPRKTLRHHKTIEASISAASRFRLDSWLTASSRVTARQHAHFTYVAILLPDALPLTKPRKTLRHHKTIKCLRGSPLLTGSLLKASSRLAAKQHPHLTYVTMPLPDALQMQGTPRSCLSRALPARE